ncbi:G-box-binding factor 3 [Silene latifolia]|uniref:G-box-binding factor 3 n=1 Tax=Silene latifolia TaxID=37657 RepID=UPI003D7700F2
MGGSDGESAKLEKSPPPAATGTEQSNVHVYPDWAAMQAYYGPRVAMPPYYNQAVASGHLPPPYMWGPQPMMSPYGAPYAAIYAAQGVYAHPAVPLGTPANCQAAVNEPLAGTPLSIDTPVKSSGNADKGLMKRLKGFDGLAMSIGNNNVNAKVEGSAENMSQSDETEGSSGGSDGNTEEADKKKRKKSQEGTSTDGDGREDEQAESKFPVSFTSKVLGHPINPANAAAGHVVGTVITPTASTALELLNPAMDVKVNSATVSSSNTAVSSDVWIQNEREMKRERRKQSNRESARRSRLRKQAEAEELGKRVDCLNAENFALKSEISQLAENSNKLRLENAALLEKLKNLQSEVEENVVEIKRNPTDSTENLLSRVNNSSSVSKNSEEGTDMYEKSSKSAGGSKFHQLLSAKPRADAVAAG